MACMLLNMEPHVETQLSAFNEIALAKKSASAVEEKPMAGCPLLEIRFCLISPGAITW